MSFFEFPHTRTYDSDLGWLIAKMKELLDAYETILADVEDLHNLVPEVATLETYLKALQTKVKNLTSEVNDVEEDLAKVQKNNVYLSKQFSALLDDFYELEDLVNLCRIEIKAFYGTLDSELIKVCADYINRDYELKMAFDEAISRLDQNIEAVAEELIRLEEELPTDILNPLWGYKMSFQDNNNQIYADLSYGALTVAEYRELNLSVTEYTNRALTVVKYYLYGRYVLGHALWTYGAISGVKKSISNALNEIVTYISGTLTAAAYEALNLTSAEYNDLALSSIDYFSFNPNLTNLSVNDYTKLKANSSKFIREYV